MRNDLYSLYIQVIIPLKLWYPVFESLDESKVSRAQLRITALSSGGSFLDGYDISIVSVAVLTMKTQFSLSSGSSTLLLGSTFIGMIIGGITMGYLTDLRGRRYLFLWDMALFIIFTVLSAISSNFIEILIFRLLLGVAIGADYAISPTIIAEFSPSRHRGKLLTISGVSWFFGAAASYAIGTALSPIGISAWRYMFMLGVIPAIIVLILRFAIPESPRWLAEMGKSAEAEKSLEKIGISTGRVARPEVHKAKLSDLFGKAYRKPMIFISIFWFALDAATFAIALQGPSILVALGLSEATASGYASIIAFLAIAGGFLALMTVDRFGRKPITIIGFAGMIVTLLGAAVLLSFSRNITGIVLLFIAFEISQEFGPGITNAIYPQELFPTNIRATAQGYGTTISRVGAVFGIFAFSAVSGPFGYTGGMVLLAAISAMGLIATIRYGVETRGRSLDNLESPVEGLKDKIGPV